jgi:hypothetical protein
LYPLHCKTPAEQFGHQKQSLSGFGFANSFFRAARSSSSVVPAILPALPNLLQPDFRQPSVASFHPSQKIEIVNALA